MDVLLVKYCPGCNKIFPATNEFFGKSKRSKDGLRYYCKSCNNEEGRNYYYRTKNHQKQRSHNYYINHKEDRSKKINLWWKNNPHKLRVKEARRRARKLNQTPILTQNEKQQVISIYKKSVELGENYHVDHIIALSNGGLHHPDNLQIVTKKYNLEKGSKLNFRLPLNTEVYRCRG